MLSNSMNVPRYTGDGYIIFDPLTGDGAYKIGGGLNGGFLAGFLIVTALIIGVLTLFPVGAAAIATGWAATAVPFAVLGSLVSFLGLESLFGDEPSFNSCFKVGVAAALVIYSGGLFALAAKSGEATPGMALSSGAFLANDIPSCF